MDRRHTRVQVVQRLPNDRASLLSGSRGRASNGCSSGARLCPPATGSDPVDRRRRAGSLGRPRRNGGRRRAVRCPPRRGPSGVAPHGQLGDDLTTAVADLLVAIGRERYGEPGELPEAVHSPAETEPGRIEDIRARTPYPLTCSFSAPGERLELSTYGLTVRFGPIRLPAAIPGKWP